MDVQGPREVPSHNKIKKSEDRYNIEGSNSFPSPKSSVPQGVMAHYQDRLLHLLPRVLGSYYCVSDTEEVNLILSKYYLQKISTVEWLAASGSREEI